MSCQSVLFCKYEKTSIKVMKTEYEKDKSYHIIDVERLGAEAPGFFIVSET